MIIVFYLHEMCVLDRDPKVEVTKSLERSSRKQMGKLIYGNYMAFSYVTGVLARKHIKFDPPLCWYHLQALACKIRINPTQDPIVQTWGHLMNDGRIVELSLAKPCAAFLFFIKSTVWSVIFTWKPSS